MISAISIASIFLYVAIFLANISNDFFSFRLLIIIIKQCAPCILNLVALFQFSQLSLLRQFSMKILDYQATAKINPSG